VRRLTISTPNNPGNNEQLTTVVKNFQRQTNRKQSATDNCCEKLSPTAIGLSAGKYVKRQTNPETKFFTIVVSC
jgi:hypothetical protein